MKQYVADSNIVLRYILNDIQEQADEVEKYFLQAAKGKILVTIPVIVFVELVYVLLKQYTLSRTDIYVRLRIVVQMSHLDIENRHLIMHALSVWSKTPVSFIDCLIMSEAKEKGKELLTFDRKLKRLASMKVAH